MTHFLKRCTVVLIPMLLLMLALALGSAPAFAAKKVRFVYVGWTDVTITTETATAVLESLGYEPTALLVSVPIAYEAMASNEADVFLGNWMPSMQTIADKFFQAGTVEKLVANMPGAKYTLAVPAYAYEGGLKHFKDIATFGDKLEWKIYGIEEGNDGNEIIQGMIDQDLFGLGKFTLIPSSEPAMLGQVRSFAKEDKWIVFLGWSPHSMNENIDMRYLAGSDAATFGEDDGSATVWTNVRAGFVQEMPNVGKLLENMKFPVSMLNQIMLAMHETQGLEPRAASLAWLKANPELYKGWFEGVTTADGKPALQAWEQWLAAH